MPVRFDSPPPPPMASLRQPGLCRCRIAFIFSVFATPRRFSLRWHFPSPPAQAMFYADYHFIFQPIFISPVTALMSECLFQYRRLYFSAQ